MKYSNVLLTATTTTARRLTAAPKDGNFHFGPAFPDLHFQSTQLEK